MVALASSSTTISLPLFRSTSASFTTYSKRKQFSIFKQYNDVKDFAVDPLNNDLNLGQFLTVTLKILQRLNGTEGTVKKKQPCQLWMKIFNNMKSDIYIYMCV